MAEQPKPGSDLSYYLGPDAKCATAAQCEELKRMFSDAAREVRQPKSAH